MDRFKLDPHGKGPTGKCSVLGQMCCYTHFGLFKITQSLDLPPNSGPLLLPASLFLFLSIAFPTIVVLALLFLEVPCMSTCSRAPALG